MAIDSFKNECAFLSNFFLCDIPYKGIIYPSVEHFFQAMKTIDLKTRKAIAESPSSAESKRLGRSVKLRTDWEDVKLSIMYTGLLIKFSEHDRLRRFLIATYPEEIVEGNHWGDEIWGVDIESGEGRNLLGKLLMKLRTRLAEEQLLER